MHARAESGTASHEAYRAQQLGGGLALRPSAVQRTSLALRGVQKVARDASESFTPVRVPLLKQASSAVVASMHDAVVETFRDRRYRGVQGKVSCPRARVQYHFLLLLFLGRCWILKALGISP